MRAFMPHLRKMKWIPKRPKKTPIIPKPGPDPVGGKEAVKPIDAHDKVAALGNKHRRPD
jgi:hypothetical protein